MTQSLLGFTFEVCDVNEEHGNMVHNYLLDKNKYIGWDHGDPLSLDSFTGSPRADPPDEAPSDDDNQHGIAAVSTSPSPFGINVMPCAFLFKWCVFI